MQNECGYMHKPIISSITCQRQLLSFVFHTWNMTVASGKRPLEPKNLSSSTPYGNPSMMKPVDLGTEWYQYVA